MRQLFWRKIPKNIGILPDWYSTRNTHTQIAIDGKMHTAPWLGTEFSISQYNQAIESATSKLATLGIKKKDIVTIIRENHFEIQFLSAALARIGAIPAPLATTNDPNDIIQLLETLQPKKILISSRFASQLITLNVMNQIPSDAIVFLDDYPELFTKAEDTLVWNDITNGPPAPMDPVEDDELMLITHTSGTTNTPKLVMHTANTLWAGTRVELLPIPGGYSKLDDVFVSAIPFSHSRSYTWVTAQFYWKPKTMVAMGDFSPVNADKIISHYKPTIIESLPNVFQLWKKLLFSKPEIFAQIKLYINTFDAVHAAIAQPYLVASNNKAMWAHSWGQSEVGPIAAGIFTKKSFKNNKNSVQMGHLGVAWPGLIKLRVVDSETGNPVKRGTPGLLQIKSDSVAIGYLGNEKFYNQKWEDNWWNTGDIGYLDFWGRVRFVDRAADKIDESSLIEIESILLERIEHCLEVIVLPNKDNPPTIVISMEEGYHLSSRKWSSLTTDLQPFGKVEFIKFSDLPRTPSWKIKRTLLRNKLNLDIKDLDYRFV